MKNLLIVSGHPYASQSVGNKRIIETLKEKYPYARFDDLAIHYPDYNIDIEQEKEKLLWADIIVVQSPLF